MTNTITADTLDTTLTASAATTTPIGDATITDPFDEPLEIENDEELIFNDIYFAEARKAITVEGMSYSFLKPSYMNFEDHIKAKKKLKEALTQCEFLLMYGYSGCGKTTILEQFAEKYPHYVYLINNFNFLSPMELMVEMGKCINVPIKRRKSEIITLVNAIKYHPGITFLFDEVSADPFKLSLLRKIHEDAHTPIVICGTPLLYSDLYDSKHYEEFSPIITRLDEHELHGMRRIDAGNYLNLIAEKECISFTYRAEQILISIAMNPSVGGIHAFTTIIGRCITVARVLYYKAPGHSFPDNTRCLRPAIPEGKAYPGAELILTPPATPEPVIIDESMVNQMRSEYKSHFPKANKQ